MKSRWFGSFGSIAAAAALAATALAVTPEISPALAAQKSRPPGSARAGKAAPPLPLETVGPIDTQARAALVMDVETGTVLLDKNSDERIPPASMSKLMTAYVVFNYLKEGRA